ncbi:helix-turn-helix domain-containing protein [Cryobacterium sp. PH31-AA6]|uniref:PucR family transcriptional regulator n=1 Tax=Cryobacterium sp. PH31-AA6 TaxID=3046205 RepID=UPI0024B9993C|nr:helix-turn-helix domain-containing protein [Cryobacterium sp. PH31-AA6]MDJ0322689.1 helix-turn-helix domain-containing protein [Cryobacterium sp. PH31-AA6]
MTSLPARPAGIAVSELLTVLDGSGLRLASGQAQLRLSLTSPTLFDPLVPFAGRRSGILLAIGVHPLAVESAEVLRSAARSGFGAVVIKALGLSVETLAAVADAIDIALFVVDDEVEWRQLDSLITSALTTAPEDPGSLSGLAVGDLFALANAIAAMVGGATAIEDLQDRVLAYSTLPGQPTDETRRDGILGRQVPDLPDNAEAYASLFQATGAVRLPGAVPERRPGLPTGEKGLPRLAIAVRAGTQPLGSIWVIDEAGTLDSDAEGALERAADIAALHILRARSAADVARQQRAELLRRLLEGGEDSRLVAGQLGIDTAGSFVAVAFQPDFGPAGDELRLNRLVDLIVMHCETHEQGTECVVIGNIVYALFTGVTGSQPSGAQFLAARLAGVEAMVGRLVARAATALRIVVRASIGSQVTSVGRISRSRRDADLVLLLLASGPAAGAVASAGDVRSHLTLLELAGIFRDNPGLRSQQAVAVLEFDERSGTDYARTLRTYLDCARDSASTALRLDVHQNTLRYRLRRAHELFAIDLADAEDTLTLWLSLRVAEFD